jgi:hypothetical protein
MNDKNPFYWRGNIDEVDLYVKRKMSTIYAAVESWKFGVGLSYLIDYS